MGFNMKPNFALSLFIGVLCSTFITAIYTLMSTVPALVDPSKTDPNLVGNIVLVWLFMSAIITYGMQSYQRMLQELNKPRSDDTKKDEHPDDSSKE